MNSKTRRNEVKEHAVHKAHEKHAKALHMSLKEYDSYIEEFLHPMEKRL